MDLVKHTPWLVPLILAGMVAAVSVLRPAETVIGGDQAAEKATSAKQQQPDAQQSDGGSSAKNTQPKAKIYSPDCEKPENHPEADLCVQRRMADAAEKQNIINGIGLGALIATLAATWLTLSTMRDTAQKQLRAYVFARPQDVDLKGDTLEVVKFTVRNHGQTPARNVAIQAVADVMQHPLPADFDLGTITHRESTQSISPETDLSAPLQVNRRATNAVLAQLDADTHRLYALAIIRYKNIFGQTCTTKVCASTPGPAFAQALRASAAGQQGTAPTHVFWEYSALHNEND